MCSVQELAALNEQCALLSLADLLIAVRSRFPRAVQETGGNLGGSVILHASQAAGCSFPLVWIDTLHHFEDTRDYVTQTLPAVYPTLQLRVCRPELASSRAEFAQLYGDQLWISNEEAYYRHSKIEPLQRCLEALQADAVITGRRKSQGGARAALPLVEQDAAGRVVVNPLASWSYAEVQRYVEQHRVPHNPLHEQGYRSIGDAHSTRPTHSAEPERSGRFVNSATRRTECGIHANRATQ